MLVKERMSHPVITVHPELPMQEALSLMRAEHIRRLPVVDKRGGLVGIVSERDLLHAAPSDATSLSIWEIHYLLSQITIEKIMTREVITIAEETPLEEAARIMADRKIGGLPVVRDGEVVGIVTETDLFRVFLEMLGAREPGIRITALVPNVPGELARLTRAVFEAGGNILALGTFLGGSAEEREVMLKVDGASAQVLREAIGPIVKRAVDVREVAAA
jgi:acetoin utilization protein AcuB